MAKLSYCSDMYRNLHILCILALSCSALFRVNVSTGGRWTGTIGCTNMYEFAQLHHTFTLTARFERLPTDIRLRMSSSPTPLPRESCE